MREPIKERRSFGPAEGESTKRNVKVVNATSVLEQKDNMIFKEKLVQLMYED